MKMYNKQNVAENLCLIYVLYIYQGTGRITLRKQAYSNTENFTTKKKKKKKKKFR